MTGGSALGRRRDVSGSIGPVMVIMRRDVLRYRSIARVAAFAMLAAMLAGGSSARAVDGDNGDVYSKRMFGSDFGKQDKSYACFVRRYDAAHLAKHSLQKVSAMTLLITAETDAEDKTLNYSFRLGVKFRHRPGNFDSSGNCGRAAASEVSADKLHLGCAVDCDGGGISVELSNADKSTLVRLDSIRIWRNNKPEDEGLDLSGGADDRVFRLDRANLEVCRSLVADRKELAAMRHK
jgi:hypothetical protein